MLKQLLSIIKKGEIHSVREMAAELDVSQNMVEQMLDDLVHSGYLRVQAQDCSQLCNDCKLKRLCLHDDNKSSKPAVWILTNNK